MANQLSIPSLPFLSKSIFRHSIIWISILLVLMFYQGFKDGIGFAFFNNFITVSFYAILVYINLYYLIPEYLSKNKFLFYSSLLFLSCFIITPIREITQYAYYELIGNEVAQEFLLDTVNIQFLIAFLVVGASTILKIISDWVRHTRERQELQTRTMQSELRFLKSQINPHFLFNTLNNLYALTLKKDDKAPEIVIKLSEMMRYMLYECNERRVLLQKEINYIRNYLDLESLRQGKNVSIEFEVNGRISDQQIAPLMFIPFLENSFKHGLNHSIKEGFVKIELNVDEKEVNFNIENSKADRIITPTRGKSGGIGLVNVRRRLDLLYPEQYELSVEDRPNTYAANLLLTLD